MRVGGIVAAVTAVLFVVLLEVPLHASGIDSEHLFGLTEGSDIGTPGERELELEFGGHLGKRDGTYRVFSQATALKLTLTDSFRVAPIVSIDRHKIRGVTGFDDRNQWALSEFAFEMKYRAMDRQSSPFGLTFGATPSWARVDEAGGERADSFGLNLTALADKELIADRLLAAFNLGFATGAGRLHASHVWQHDSSLFVSGALSARLSERVFIGGEVRYERVFEGMGLDRFAGHAVFIGPSIYARLSENAWVSILWNAQIAGHAAGDGRVLDLTNFERHLVKARLGIQF